MNRIWATVIDGATGELGRDCVDQWIRPVKLSRINKDHAVLATATGFVADWVERNYGRHILRELQKAVPGVKRINMTVSGQGGEVKFTPASPSKAPPKQETAPVLRERPAEALDPAGRLDSSPLDSRFTFDSFVVGKPNELAHAAARRVAETADASFNPVFLYGGVGRGKTHLMHAIGWQMAETFPGRRVLYLSAEQFMYRFIAALRSRDTYTFKQQFRSVDV
ncbi:MAG: DnaA/Hda family protein, partial [Pseudomonadota bacterium]